MTRKVRAIPTRTPALPLKTCGRAEKVTVRPAGTLGMKKSMQARETSPRMPTAANAVRHPLRSPMSVPLGTPRTDAVSTPPKITAVARATCLAGTSRRAMPPAMDQKPPTLRPIRNRATRTTVKLVAKAEARLAAPISPIRTTRTTRRSMCPVATVTRGAETAATRPGTVTMSPAVPSEMSRAWPTGVSSPTGSSSEVIREKMPRVTAMTASQPLTGERPVASVVPVSTVVTGYRVSCAW
ncbi:hypothetical protein SBADM41S_05017 [Streptomyces badius]